MYDGASVLCPDEGKLRGTSSLTGKPRAPHNSEGTGAGLGAEMRKGCQEAPEGWFWGLGDDSPLQTEPLLFAPV